LGNILTLQKCPLFQEPTGIIDFLLDCLPFPEEEEEEDEELKTRGEEEPIPLPFSPNLAHTTDVTQVPFLSSSSKESQNFTLPRFPWTYSRPGQTPPLNNRSPPPPSWTRRRRRSWGCAAIRGGGGWGGEAVDAITQ
jgi:hypothetical protein